MKRFAILLISWLLVSMGTYAQRAVHLGNHHFIPEQNLGHTRGANPVSIPALGIATNGYYNALVQFAELPSKAQASQLARAGLLLCDYLGGNAYYALLHTGLNPTRLLRSTTATSLVPVQPGWKLDAMLEMGRIPAYAAAGIGDVRVAIRYAQNIEPEQALATLGEMGVTDLRASSEFRTVYGVMAAARSGEIANLP